MNRSYLKALYCLFLFVVTDSPSRCDWIEYPEAMGFHIGHPTSTSRRGWLVRKISISGFQLRSSSLNEMKQLLLAFRSSVSLKSGIPTRLNAFRTGTSNITACAAGKC
ncbi:MAG: hypothetical protein V2A54_14635 [Bacteroidota bacterium]